MPEYLAIYDHGIQYTTGDWHKSQEEERFKSRNDKAAIKKAEDLSSSVRGDPIKRGYAKLESLFQVREIPLG